MLTLKQFCSALWGMCRLRQGPADLPRNHLLFGTVIVLYFLEATINPNTVLISLVGNIDDVSSGDYLLVNLLDKFLVFVFELLYVWCVLRLFNLQARTYETFFAVVATFLIFGVIMYLVLAPIILMSDIQQTTNSMYLLVPVLLLITYWFFLVGPHIFRRSMDTTFPRGLLVCLGFLFLPQLVLKAMSVWLL